VSVTFCNMLQLSRAALFSFQHFSSLRLANTPFQRNVCHKQTTSPSQQSCAPTHFRHMLCVTSACYSLFDAEAINAQIPSNIRTNYPWLVIVCLAKRSLYVANQATVTNRMPSIVQFMPP
jgi:hypothetical protein